MTKPKFLTANFIESAVRFLVYYLAVALTPLLGKGTAHIWDWVAYGSLHALFAEIHTVFFWLAEALIFLFVGKLLRKKGILPPKSEEKESWAPVPRKNLFILTGLVVGCIFLLSAIIGFQVKPFYDLGEKVTGYDIWCTVGAIGRNAFKCMWIMGMLVHCFRMANILVDCYDPQRRKWLQLLLAAALLMTFGVFDIFTSAVTYPLGVRGAFVALTYVLFYAIFPVVYHYARENKGKAYLIIVFIYLF